MKTNLIWCTAFVLGFAAIAASQEADRFYVTDSARDYHPYGRSHFQAAAVPYDAVPYDAVPYDCEADCQIEWGTFRNGSLWENYCVEKQISREHLMRIDRPCLDDRCQPSPGLFTPHRGVPCDPPSHARRSNCHRERLLSFNLFCELFGWRDCDCSAGSCCDGPSCSSAAPHNQGMDDFGPTVNDTEPASELPRVPSPNRPGATEHAESHNHAADGHVSPMPTQTSEPVPPTPEQLVPEPPVQQTAPAVPRNKLPQAKPVSTRRPARKVLVAERLSDYIKI